MEKKVDKIVFKDGSDLLVGYVDIEYRADEILYKTKMYEDSEELMIVINKSEIRYLQQRGTVGKEKNNRTS